VSELIIFPECRSHYQWLDKHLNDFWVQVIGKSLADSNCAGIIGAHGDKGYGYRSEWEKAGIHYYHAMALYLLTYTDVMDRPKHESLQWVIEKYPAYKEYLPVVKTVARAKLEPGTRISYLKMPAEVISDLGGNEIHVHSEESGDCELWNWYLDDHVCAALCDCDMTIKLNGDGCLLCNPDFWAEQLVEQQGFTAFESGENDSANTYFGTDRESHWQSGWQEAKSEYSEAG